MGRPKKYGTFSVNEDMETSFSLAQETIEELYLEIESWLSSIGDTNFEYLQDSLEDCYSVLDNSNSQLEEVEDLISEVFPFFPKIKYEEIRLSILPKKLRCKNAINILQEILTTLDESDKTNWTTDIDIGDVFEGISLLQDVVSDLETLTFPKLRY